MHISSGITGGNRKEWSSTSLRIETMNTSLPLRHTVVCAVENPPVAVIACIIQAFQYDSEYRTHALTGKILYVLSNSHFWFAMFDDTQCVKEQSASVLVPSSLTNPRLFPAMEMSWQGKPYVSRSISVGRAFSSTLVISPDSCFLEHGAEENRLLLAYLSTSQ